MVQHPLWSASGETRPPGDISTAYDAAAAGTSAGGGLYPTPALHVLQAPNTGAAVHPLPYSQPQLPGSATAQWQQQLQQQQQPAGGQDAMQRQAAPASGGKASPMAREPYPVVVHCVTEADLPSRNASTDPAGRYLVSRGPLSAGSGGGVGGVVSAGGAQQQREQQQTRHMLQIASWLVPDPRRRFWAVFTSAVVLGMSFVFAFQAADYATWLRTPAGAAASGGAPVPSSDEEEWGPARLARWLRFWEISTATSFSPAYLFAWGARYMPAVKAGQWWRLFSSFCLHASFTHLLSNMVLFVLLAVPLEHTYGPFRVGVIFLASAFGANFLSITFEDNCVIYVGASGAVFGFCGLAISDLLLNWDNVGAPVVRLLVMLATLGVSIAVEYTATPYLAGGKVSHLSHIGGLLGGLFVSFAFLPNLADRRFQAMRRIVERTWGHRLPRAAPREHKSCWHSNPWLYWLCMAVCAVAVLFLFCLLPVWIWVLKLPHLECPPVEGLM